MNEPKTIPGVLAWILADPWETLLRRWNYKSALLSGVIRAGLFFATNMRAGTDAAVAAMTTEMAFRFATSGFYGAFTQSLRRAEPRWAATLCALLVIPLISHGADFAVHWWRGTPELAVSIVASVALTMISTGFNLFAMRRGSLIVGNAAPTLLADLRAMPRLMVLFVVTIFRTCIRACL